MGQWSAALSALLVYKSTCHYAMEAHEIQSTVHPGADLVLPHVYLPPHDRPHTRPCYHVGFMTVIILSVIIPTLAKPTKQPGKEDATRTIELYKG